MKSPEASSLKIPEHVAIIMDGNGRWAKERGLSRIEGHRSGAESCREVVVTAAESGIRYVTLYAFSVENWNRPKMEVSTLMRLLEEFLKKKTPEFIENNIRLRAIGRLSDLPKKTLHRLEKSIEETSHCTGLTLILALSYGGRVEIVEAVQTLAKQVQQGKLKPDQIDEKMISQYLYTREYPDPDLLIRTSGEMRLSNFLLWQNSYTEIYVTKTFWPDFRKKAFLDALEDYSKRQRRFGRV